jgi:ABC-type lipoprotein export system ATPase subunit
MIKLRAIRLDGFRGYPLRATFDLPKDGSLLLFGRNAQGKSSLSDAFEFLRNRDGTLERLGLRKGETTSGRAPLRNSRLKRDQASVVTITLESGGKKRDIPREASEGGSDVPAELLPFVEAAIVPFIIRGPELREFVQQTPRNLYDQLARFLNASRLIQLQSDVRELQTELGKDERGDDRHRKALDESVKMLTSDQIKRYDEKAMVGWLNSMLSPMSIAMGALSDSDAGYCDLKLREANERSTIALETALANLRNLVQPVGGSTLIDRWLEPIERARRELAEIAKATADAPIASLIEAAAEYLADPAHAPESCPLCETAYERTVGGTRDALLERLERMRATLQQLRSAAERVKAKEADLARHRDGVVATLRQTLAPANVDVSSIENLRQLCVAAFDGGVEERRTFEAAVKTLAPQLDEVRIKKALAPAGSGYNQLLRSADACLALLSKRSEIDERSARRARALADVERARKFIDDRVYRFFEATVKAISDDTVAFYRDVQKNSRVPVAVKVTLAKQQREDPRGVEVLLDFDGLPDVKPQAYLSDSQQHTLALALRLAIIKHFNRDLPLIVLDDVVTSYDAETRKTMANAFVTHLHDVQLIVLTHDDMFWRYMRMAFNAWQARWKVTRVVKYEPDAGPSFIDDKGDVAEIRRLIAEGSDQAAAAVRKFYERWLYPLARGVGARPLMPIETDPYDYQNRDLLDSLVKATEKCGLRERLTNDHRLKTIVNNLRDSVVLNKGTHGDDSQDGQPSAGDVEDMFDELLELVQFFTCRCGETSYRYDSNEIRCSKCKEKLSISPATPA